MKRSIQLFSSAIIMCAVMGVSSAFATNVHANTQPSYTSVSSDDTLSTAKKMRVVFLPRSDYKNFRIGIESNTKTDVNVQVINSKGLVVYSNLLERVTKRLEEINFSFLKKGEYTVKVTNQEDEYTKMLVIP
jgi:hypothetical protein